MNMNDIKPGTVIKRVDKPRTFRIIEEVRGGYIYTRKPNRVPERISINNYMKYWKLC